MGACGSAVGPWKKRSSAIDRIIRNNNNTFKRRAKILLLGPGESGKSTVFKQLKIVHTEYTREELMSYKPVIFSNAISQMRVILEAVAFLGIQLKSEAALQNAQTILSLPPTSISMDAEIAESIRMLWEDQGIKEAYALGTQQYQLNETAEYFFDNITRFADPDYCPEERDILRARVRSTGIHFLICL